MLGAAARIVGYLGRRRFEYSPLKYALRWLLAIVTVWVFVQVVDNLGRYMAVRTGLFSIHGTATSLNADELAEQITGQVQFAIEWLEKQDVEVEWNQTTEIFTVNAPFVWKIDLYFWRLEIEELISSSVAAIPNSE